MVRRVLVLLCVGALLSAADPTKIVAQDGSLIAPADTTRPDSLPSPRGALWRAAAVPGWGQYYNGDYLKIPVLYGLLGGMTAAVWTIHGLYRTYDRAFLYRTYRARVETGTIDEHPYPEFESDYRNLLARHGDLSPETLRRQRDKFRRNRDLTVLGIAAVYGLSIVDAYVSAHLATFDVSDDLSIRVRPTGRGAALAVRW